MALKPQSNNSAPGFIFSTRQTMSLLHTEDISLLKGIGTAPLALLSCRRADSPLFFDTCRCLGAGVWSAGANSTVRYDEAVALKAMLVVNALAVYTHKPSNNSLSSLSNSRSRPFGSFLFTASKTPINSIEPSGASRLMGKATNECRVSSPNLRCSTHVAHRSSRITSGMLTVCPVRKQCPAAKLLDGPMPRLPREAAFADAQAGGSRNNNCCPATDSTCKMTLDSSSM
mmetsp:Transcript_73601/g.213206  ORF Transcript_73601/g.213206 Transcript_73601/m.213206 type:complete len:229 (+) Transcript_73601:2055-2741(+)